MNRLANVFQFILGFFLGVFLLAAGGAGLGFIFFSRLAAPPPKPIFSEEKPASSPDSKQEKAPTKKAATKKEVAEQPKASPSPAEKTETAEKLPPGSYKARVNWSSGLSLRAEPSKEAERIGGVEYNQEIIILEKSRDGQWEKVRVAGGSQEGWVKAGNVEKIEE